MDEMGHGMGRGSEEAGGELEIDVNADREDSKVGGAGIQCVPKCFSPN
jgi:hypothetical protein